jgi:hypothetical protein
MNPEANTLPCTVNVAYYIRGYFNLNKPHDYLDMWVSDVTLTKFNLHLLTLRSIKPIKAYQYYSRYQFFTNDHKDNYFGVARDFTKLKFIKHK